MSFTTHFSPLLLQQFLSMFGDQLSEIERDFHNLAKLDENYDYQSSIELGGLLKLLVRLSGAKHCLEVGTYLGYSSYCLASKISSDGKVVTIEKNPKYAKIASSNFERMGVGHLVEIKVCEASSALSDLRDEGAVFDLAFVDADKNNFMFYFEVILTMLSARGIIVVDNVFRQGRTYSGGNDLGTQTVRNLVERTHFSKELYCVVLPVGDGVMIAGRSS